MAIRAAVPFLVAMMLVTGVANTLLTKYQDKQCVQYCDDPDRAKRKYFEQPVLQTAQMFVGEMGCWLVVAGAAIYRRLRARIGGCSGDEHIVVAGARLAEVDGEQTRLLDDGREASNSTSQRNKSFVDGTSNGHGLRILLLALPAVCDILGTTLMNAGLLLVAASIYQMTRGTLVLFVGLFSVVFLRRQLYLFQWVSLIGVVVGVGVVGLAGVIDRGKATGAAGSSTSTPLVLSSEPAADPALAVLGVLLIAGAQIFTASQFVLEEWILGNSTMEPINVVGWEGTFGLAFTLLGMLALHLTIGGTADGAGGPFDAVEGWRQMTSSKEIAISSILIMISIGGFNFFGLSVTRTVSATSRSTIDTCRTLFIWMISLGLQWETFKWLQVVGFALLVYFTFLFNGMVQPPLACLIPEDDDVEETLQEESAERI
jgi:hypothetical protein